MKSRIPKRRVDGVVQHYWMILNKFVKRKFPNQDFDLDGKKNKDDCVPLNPFRHMAEEDVEGFEGMAKGKEGKFTSETQVPLLRGDPGSDYSVRTEMISPHEYFRRAGQSHGTWDVEKYKEKFEEDASKASLKEIEKGLKEREGKVPAPWLKYEEETSTLKIPMYTGQEGRHRALVAEKLGISKIPVRIVRRLRD